MDKNKGITLMVLIITVILMLILAGVTIGALRGDNGLITQAKIAAQKAPHMINDTGHIIQYLNFDNLYIP